MKWNEYCKLLGIKKSYQLASLNDLNDQRREIAVKWLKRPYNLILYGETGRGKTHMIYAIVRALIEKDWRYAHHLRFIKSKDLDDALMEQIMKTGSPRTFIKSIQEVPLLFWDDFGVERETDRLIRDYTDILDEREDRGTIISTNLSPEQVEKNFGPRFFSRLHLYDWKKLGGEDKRKKKTQTEEIDPG